MKDLSLSDGQMGWVVSAFSLGYALFQIPSGLLADRYGPRRVLATIVTAWSIFTALTGAAFNFASMLLIRFLFGMGEAGAYPGSARAVFSWIPMSERGLVQGINFSGARVGAAFTLPAVAWMASELGWRISFVFLAGIGLVWGAWWYFWFRDDPAQHPRISDEEVAIILSGRQSTASNAGGDEEITPGALARSRNMWLAMAQYFASNFTFFFCLSWLFPHLQKKFNLGSVETGLYAAVPVLSGALGHWLAGSMVDWVYRRGRWTLSRRLPAMVGFALAAAGMMLSVGTTTLLGTVVCLSLAILGADMTISPSWALCIDIGRRHSGTVSGTMNMAGNFGSFVTGLAFPYLEQWTGSTMPFFLLGASLNILGIGAWMLIRPDRRLEEY